MDILYADILSSIYCSVHIQYEVRGQGKEGGWEVSFEVQIIIKVHANLVQHPSSNESNFCNEKI